MKSIEQVVPRSAVSGCGSIARGIGVLQSSEVDEPGDRRVNRAIVGRPRQLTMMKRKTVIVLAGIHEHPRSRPAFPAEWFADRIVCEAQREYSCTSQEIRQRTIPRWQAIELNAADLAAR